jgi:hypothetical protein
MLLFGTSLKATGNSLIRAGWCVLTEVRIVSAAVDVAVDPITGDIIPGLGNFVARYNDDERRV